MKRFVSWLGVMLWVAASGLFTGCASDPGPAKIAPKEMNKLRTFYVVKAEDDTRATHTVIAEQLGLMGFTATASDTAPANAEAVVNYSASWDRGQMYLLEIRIELRSPGVKPEVFSSRSYLERKKPAEMAHELLEFMLDRGLSPFAK